MLSLAAILPFIFTNQYSIKKLSLLFVKAGRSFNLKRQFFSLVEIVAEGPKLASNLCCSLATWLPDKLAACKSVASGLTAACFYILRSISNSAKIPAF